MIKTQLTEHMNILRKSKQQHRELLLEQHRYPNEYILLEEVRKIIEDIRFIRNNFSDPNKFDELILYNLNYSDNYDCPLYYICTNSNENQGDYYSLDIFDNIDLNCTNINLNYIPIINDDLNNICKMFYKCSKVFNIDEILYMIYSILINLFIITYVTEIVDDSLSNVTDLISKMLKYSSFNNIVQDKLNYIDELVIGHLIYN